MGLASNSLKAQNGWMISSSFNTSNPPYYIWHTTNGGADWSVQYTDNTQGSFQEIQFTDLNNGWVVGDSGKILKTTNGGANWTPVTNAGITTDSKNNCLFFLNANTGWIGNHPNGNPRIVLHTVNGGATWSTQNVPNQYAILSIYFIDANNGWLTSDYGQIAHTTTGGGSGWVLQTNPSAKAGKVQFVSPTEGWISSGGQLLHTTNAGANWAVVTPFPNDTVISSTGASNMWWVNQTHGWKLNSFGTGSSDLHGTVIYQTINGGSTWGRNVLSTAAGDLGMQVQFVDENNGWASIFNFSDMNMSLLRSSDGGNNWSPITMTPGVGGIFYFVDAGNGIEEGLINNPANNPINIFPNPTEGTFYITFKNAATKQKIEVYNIYGDKIYTASNFKQQTSNKINLSIYFKGIYFTKIFDGEKIYTDKILIR